jgi:hypothetical protein
MKGIGRRRFRGRAETACRTADEDAKDCHPAPFTGSRFGLDPEDVRNPSKTRAPAAARGIICHLAIFEYGYRGNEVGRFLHLGLSGVSLAAKRGRY